jgi:hypothetical protein
MLQEDHRITLKKHIAIAGLILAGTLSNAFGQSVTGGVQGNLVDPSGAAVNGSVINLSNDITKQVRQFTTGYDGSFDFSNVLPGTYTIRVVQNGFKSYFQTGIVVSAQERLDVHTIRLELGDVDTSVEVIASPTHVSTNSSDRAITVDNKQIGNTPIRGRDYQAIWRGLPGVQDLGVHDTRGLNSGLAVINGGQMGQVLMTIDGAATQDSGSPSIGTELAPSIDAISEVKLLVSNYPAEYGARNGGQVNVTTKSGTRELHGTAYYYMRHEEFNANEFFNNAQNVAKPLYRYQNPGGTFGGPVMLPGFPRDKFRNKLFFFVSYDQLSNTASALSRFTMPTALERSGDFSQSVNPNGSAILIRDPGTGATCSATSAAGCFPGNKIPASRLNPAGTAMMNLFPLPNTTDLTGNRQYNFQNTTSNQNPRRDTIVRGDYNISERDTMFVRLLHEYQAQSGSGATLGALGDNWGQFPHIYKIPSSGAVATYIHSFRPNLFNEASFGINHSHQQNAPTDTTDFQKSLLPLKLNGQALTLPNMFGANSAGLLPNIQFGLPSGFTAQSAPTAIPSLPSFGFDSRWPFDGTDQLMTITDNVTWAKGRHNIKAGVYFEGDSRNVSVYTTYGTQGTYYFGSDLAGTSDSGNPFSNAMLGNVYGYGQDNKNFINHAGYRQAEWFAQDTWRASRRLTIDAGMRFQNLGAVNSQGATLGLFSPSSYSASAAGKLLYPACLVAVPAGGSCPLASRASTNLVTGAHYSSLLQGTFDPASYSGTPFSGIQQYTTNLFNTPPLQFGPRAGLAWDIFGDGKTAFRAGFGIFYGRPFGVDTLGAASNGTGPMTAPPNFQAPIILSANISNLSGASAVFTPQNTVAGSRNYKPPSTYDWSVGIQRDLGMGWLLDIAYVGNVAHHQWNATAMDLNAVAPLTDWTPTANNGSPGPVAKYLDPTSGNGGTGAFYSTNLVRALAGGYSGWGSIPSYTQIGESNYNALQTQFNKRLGRRLNTTANWTWSKTLLYTRSQWVSDELTKNVTSNRPQAVNVTVGYDVPNASRYWKNAVTKNLLDGWHLASVGSFYSGTPLTVTCTASSAPIGYWTGTPTGGVPFRCQQTGNLWLPSSATPASVGSKADPRLWYNFNPASFSLPAANSLGIGNTPPTLTYGPGVQSVDLSLRKEIRAGGENRVISLQADMFNSFNHFNPSNPNSALAINFATGANTNTALGTITAAQVQARHMELSMRFSF